jgi:hypothetical protein
VAVAVYRNPCHHRTTLQFQNFQWCTSKAIIVHTHKSEDVDSTEIIGAEKSRPGHLTQASNVAPPALEHKLSEDASVLY